MYERCTLQPRPNNRRHVSRMAQIRYFYPELTIISDNKPMDEGIEGDRPSNDLQRDNIKDAERQVVAIADAIAPSLVFNSAAFPPNLPDHIKSALLTKADQAREAAIDAGFVRPSAIDGVASLSREERERREGEKTQNYVTALIQQDEQRRREQEEWTRTQSTISGVTMTGAEWAELADRLRNDDDLRRRVIEAFERRGMNRDEAEARYERSAQVADAMAIPPSQRNEDQKRAIKSAESDPTYKQDMGLIKAELGESQTLSRNGGLSDTFATVSEGASAPIEPAIQAPKPIVQTVGMGF